MLSTDAVASEDSIVSKYTVILDAPPSCIQFSPRYRDYFVIGTYTLDTKDPDAVDSDPVEAEQEVDIGDGMLKEPEQQSRRGTLLLFRLENLHRNLEMTLIQTLPVRSAVLDVSFRNVDYDDDQVAAATSTGTVEIFSLASRGESHPNLRYISSIKVAEESVLVLSLDWAKNDLIATSLSDGGIQVVDPVQSPPTVSSRTCHSLEAWVARWCDSSQPYRKVIYSGGDDSRICSLEFLNVSEDSQDSNERNSLPEYELHHNDIRIHKAGVTAIEPFCFNQEGANSDVIVLTGSYDEYVRVLRADDITKKWVVLAELKVGGGVFRLKTVTAYVPYGKEDSEKPEDKHKKWYFLASCMHAGTRVLKVYKTADDEWKIEVQARFTEHESMNYATDWTELVGKSSETEEFRNKGTVAVVSTSFYDKRVCSWKAELNKFYQPDTGEYVPSTLRSQTRG